jgi:hypothetical protein
MHSLCPGCRKCSAGILFLLLLFFLYNPLTPILGHTKIVFDFSRSDAALPASPVKAFSFLPDHLLFRFR